MRIFAAIIAIATLIVTHNCCVAGPVATVGRIVPSAKRVSMDEIDHSLWDQLLRHYVDSAGNVDYAGWQRSPSDLAALDKYLAILSTADLSSSAPRPTQMAFWINAYNSVTIRGILREYPTSSIRNHTARLFGYNIWNDLQLQVGGRSFSLRQIEHDVLREMGDPRIHFAIVCASSSCPRLLNQAYTPQSVDAQITANAKVFFANPGNFNFDQQRNQMQLSSILKWFAKDFGSTQAAQLRTIAPFLPNREAYDAAVANIVSVSYLGYDWSLIDQLSTRAARR